jgi:hypothetical protein
VNWIIAEDTRGPLGGLPATCDVNYRALPSKADMKTAAVVFDRAAHR